MGLVAAGFIAGKIITIKKVRGGYVHVVDVIRAVLAPTAIAAG